MRHIFVRFVADIASRKKKRIDHLKSYHQLDGGQGVHKLGRRALLSHETSLGLLQSVSYGVVLVLQEMEA